MARQTIAAIAGATSYGSFPGPYPVLPLGAGSRHMTQTAIDDQTDRSTPLIDNKTVLFAENTDSGAHTITFTSVPDDFNRAGDISAYSIPAGETHFFGPFRTKGWEHSAVLWIDVSDPKVRLSVFTLPG